MPDEATESLLSLLQEEPEDWSLRARICDEMLLEGRLGEAIGLIETAPAPPEFEAHVLKAAEIYAVSQPDKAVPLLYRYLQANPSSALAHLAMAETAAKLGQLSSAQSYYRQAVALNPAYRDPGFERQHGIQASNLTAKLPTANDSGMPSLPHDDTGSFSSEKDDEPVSHRADPSAEASPATRRNPGSRPGSTRPGFPGWVLTGLVALATFLIGWMLLALALRALLLQGLPSE